jgi:L-amino acid N-acyltransferase YncA
MAKYRNPTAADLPEIVRLAKEMHAETSFRTLSFDEAKSAAEIMSCMTNPTNFVCVAEDKGRLVGIVGVYLASPYFSNDRVVYDHMWYVSKEARGSLVGSRLLKYVSQWSEVQEAKAIFLTLGSDTHTDRTGKLAELHGYHLLGGFYRKDIENV